MSFGSLLRPWPLVAALAAGLTAAAAPAAPAKTLVYCAAGSPESFDPQRVHSGTGLDVARALYDRLIDTVPGTAELRPGLAESWTVTPDGLTWEFKLRRQVQFHSTPYFTPTRPVDADDVIFTFERMTKADNPAHPLSGSHDDSFEAMGLAGLIRRIERVDDRTVRFVLNRPYAPFLADLAMDFSAILSKDYADTMVKAGTPEKFDRRPIGTGPFVFERYEKDTDLRVRANDGYWRGRPRLDGLVFAIVPDSGGRAARLAAGDCQIATAPDPRSLAELAATPGLAVVSQATLNLRYLAYNTRKPPFDNRLVRQALNRAIDKAALLAALGGRPTATPVPPALWSHDGTIADPPANPEAARALLAETGLTLPVKTDIWAIPARGADPPDLNAAAKLIQADLAAVGFDATVITQDRGAALDLCQDGQHQMCLVDWTADQADPDAFLSPLLSCTADQPGRDNIAKWCNKAFDDLVARARASSDRTERQALYQRAQKIVHDEAPLFLIANGTVSDGISTRLVNYRPGPTGRRDFRDADLTDPVP